MAARNFEPYEQILTPEQFTAVMRCTHAKAIEWHAYMDRAMHMYNIDSSRRIAAFIGTLSFESLGLAALEESFAYSAERMCQVWPSRFFVGEPALGKRNAKSYVGKPQALAEYVYSGRMGNGPEGSGDGFKFRGRSPGHITGRDQYALLSRVLGVDFVESPHLISEPKWGSIANAYIWTEQKALNPIADGWLTHEIVRRWNGGYTDVERRETVYNENLALLVKWGIE